MDGGKFLVFLYNPFQDMIIAKTMEHFDGLNGNSKLAEILFFQIRRTKSLPVIFTPDWLLSSNGTLLSKGLL